MSNKEILLHVLGVAREIKSRVTMDTKFALPIAIEEITKINALWTSWFLVTFVTCINHQMDERSRSRMRQN